LSKFEFEKTVGGEKKSAETLSGFGFEKSFVSKKPVEVWCGFLILKIVSGEIKKSVKALSGFDLKNRRGCN